MLTVSAYLSLIALPIAMMSHPVIAAFLIACQTSLFEEQLQLNIRCHSFPFLLRRFQAYLPLLLPGTTIAILKHFQLQFEVLGRQHDWVAISPPLQDGWRQLKLWRDLEL